MLCPEPLQRTTLLFDQSSHHRSRALNYVKRSLTFLKVEPTGWPSSLSLSLSLSLSQYLALFTLSLFLSHARAWTRSHTHARTCDGGFFEANLDKSCCSQMAFLHNRELFHWLWNVFAGNGFIALLKKQPLVIFFGEKRVCVQLQPFWVKQLLLKFWTIFVNDDCFKVCVGDNFSPASSERSLCGGGKAPPIQKRYRDFLKNLTEQRHYSSLIMNQNVWYNDYHWCR